jgi:hypothetical protein
MPCSKYEGAQRRLCFATHEWKDWDDIKEYKKERLEHPSFSAKQIQTVVRDHHRRK